MVDVKTRLTAKGEYNILVNLMETDKIDFLHKLAELRADTCNSLPTPQLAVLTRLTARLRKSGITDRCLQTGETAPDFNFIDAADNPDNLYSRLEQGPVVVNFFRGDWCPYCRTEIEAYESIRPALASLGCTYLAITPQKPADATDQPPRIYDKHCQIAHQYGLVYELLEDEVALFEERGVHLDDLNESRRWELPLPATYIIVPDRTVAWQFVDVDFRARCCPMDVLREVKLLQY